MSPPQQLCVVVRCVAHASCRHGRTQAGIRCESLAHDIFVTTPHPQRTKNHAEDTIEMVKVVSVYNMDRMILWVFFFFACAAC